MDLIKRLKKINPHIRNANEGFISDIKSYVDTGSLILNAALSGTIFGGIPDNKIVGFAGANSTGKTYLALGIAEKFLKKDKNNFVFWCDTEHALDSTMLLERDMSEDELSRFIQIPVGCLEKFHNDIIQMINTVKQEREVAEKNRNLLKEKGKEDQANEITDKQILFVLDSMSQLASEKEIKDATSGDNKADMGGKAKTLRKIFRLITYDLGVMKIPMIITAHTYEDPSKMFAEEKVSGGQGLLFAASIVVVLKQPKKEKSKKDEKKIIGVILKAHLKKSRNTKQHKEITMRLFFTRGLDRYWGLTEAAIEAGMLIKEGKKYVLPNGRRAWLFELQDKPHEYYDQDFLDKLDVEIEKMFKYGQEESTVELPEDIVEEVQETTGNLTVNPEEMDIQMNGAKPEDKNGKG